jgi:hypothetical protein
MPMPNVSEKHSHNVQKNGPGGEAAAWNCLDHACRGLEDELPHEVNPNAYGLRFRVP